MKNKYPVTQHSMPVAWHEEALKESEQAQESGQADFVDWEAAKQYLRDKKNDPF